MLHCPYPCDKARLVTREMTDLLVLDLVDRRLVTDQITLTVGYDIENLKDPERRKRYRGEVTTDHYGRQIPKHAHGTVNLDRQTSSGERITEAVTGLYDRIVDRDLLVRRITITAGRVVDERNIETKEVFEQMDLFTDYASREKADREEARRRKRERRMQEAVLDIRKRFGKNAVLRGMNLEEGATARDRNQQIGGHKA